MMSMTSPVGTQQHSPRAGRMALPTRIALGVFLAIAAFFLLTEHWAHVWPFLPYLLFLACPLMHLVMHQGHSAATGLRRPARTRPSGIPSTTPSY